MSIDRHSTAAAETGPTSRAPGPTDPAARAKLAEGLWQAFLISLIWLPVAALLVSTKYAMVTMRGSLFPAAASGPRRWLAALTLFRWELVQGVVLAPLALFLLTRKLPLKLRPIVAGLLALAAFLFLYVEYRCLKTVGTFTSFALLYQGVWWAMDNPDLASRYYEFTQGILKAILLAGLIVVATIAMYKTQRVSARRWMTRLAISVHGMTALVVLLALMPWIPHSPLHRSALAKVIVSFAGNEGPRDQSLDRLQAGDLMQRYREMAGETSAPALPKSDLAGKADGFDIFWYPLETMPARCVQFSDSIDDLPTFRRLREHALVATQHYTTYPYTMSAIWSMLASSYPVNTAAMAKSLNDREVPGLMTLLRQQRGYDTSFFCPDKTDPAADTVYTALGIHDIVQGTLMPDGKLARTQPTSFRLERDRAIFQQMMQRLDSLLSQDRRYCMMFMPQLSHGPWGDLPDAAPQHDLYARGRAIMQEEDKWLAQIVSHIESKGRLNKTIFVFCGDHGVRTLVDDPDLDLGRLDDRSFHVPCMISAPGLIPAPRTINIITSHIDLTPTLAEMMNLPASPYWEGSPLWDPSLAQRRTFFWARDYLGADGYHDSGKFFMVDQLFDRHYEAEHFQSDMFRDVPPKGALAQEIDTRIRGMWNFQLRWFDLIPSPRPRP